MGGEIDSRNSSQVAHEDHGWFMWRSTEVSLSNHLLHEGHWPLREGGTLAIEAQA